LGGHPFSCNGRAYARFNFIGDRINSRCPSFNGVFYPCSPPGTGKTTLLRDVIAALVVDRARAMLAGKFEDPTAVFPKACEVRDSKYPAWAVATELCGFGMVVASANNGAVENITKELPAKKSVDAPGVEIDYFAAIAESVLADRKASARKPDTCWGLVAAALGNMGNRTDFLERFWWAKAPQKGSIPRDAFWSIKMVLEDEDANVKPWVEATERLRQANLRAKETFADHPPEFRLLEKMERSAAAGVKRSEERVATLEKALNAVRQLLSETKSQLDANRRCAAAAESHLSRRGIDDRQLRSWTIEAMPED
jgi:hypothetical protein